MYDEETEDYTNDVEELSGSIADLTKTAKTPGGISIFTDKTKQTYKDTYDIIKEIAEIWDDLSDKNRADLLEVLAGKQRGNSISALIQAFQSGQVEKAYQASIDSAGSAMQEQERWLESIDAKIQQLTATWQNFSQVVVNGDFVKTLLDTANTLLSVVTQIVDGLGVIPTLIGGAAITKLVRGGKPMGFSFYTECATSEFSGDVYEVA